MHIPKITQKHCFSCIYSLLTRVFDEWWKRINPLTFFNDTGEVLKNEKLCLAERQNRVFGGNQWGSNPRPLEPQSNALTN
jgi:hypothetical protein